MSSRRVIHLSSESSSSASSGDENIEYPDGAYLPFHLINWKNVKRHQVIPLDLPTVEELTLPGPKLNTVETSTLASRISLRSQEKDLADDEVAIPSLSFMSGEATLPIQYHRGCPGNKSEECAEIFHPQIFIKLTEQLLAKDQARNTAEIARKEGEKLDATTLSTVPANKFEFDPYTDGNLKWSREHLKEVTRSMLQTYNTHMKKYHSKSEATDLEFPPMMTPASFAGLDPKERAPAEPAPIPKPAFPISSKNVSEVAIEVNGIVWTLNKRGDIVPSQKGLKKLKLGDYLKAENWTILLAKGHQALAIGHSFAEKSNKFAVVTLYPTILAVTIMLVLPCTEFNCPIRKTCIINHERCTLLIAAREKGAIDVLDWGERKLNALRVGLEVGSESFGTIEALTPHTKNGLLTIQFKTTSKLIKLF